MDTQLERVRKRHESLPKREKLKLKMKDSLRTILTAILFPNLKL